MGAASGFVLLLALISIVLSLKAYRQDRPLIWRFKVPDTIPVSGSARFERLLDYSAVAGQAHSPAIVLQDDGFAITWFEGSEEAQADVDIYAVRFRLGPDGWQGSPPGLLVTRQELSEVFEPRQLVVTLGNTVENEARTNSIFATVVSIGGWAMASVADLRFDANGVEWARKLNLSPFLNRSHLVKSPMVTMADGSFALPAYFEMGQTYGSFVRFDGAGRVRDSRRIPGRDNKPIQPMIIALSETHAVAFLRDFDPSGKLLISKTQNGGQSWSPAASTDLANPSAPVAALALDQHCILMAANGDATSAARLCLMLSDNAGETWRQIHVLEDGGGDVRYPMLRLLPGGDILLSYSHGTKGGIRACLFNRAWVTAQ